MLLNIIILRQFRGIPKGRQLLTRFGQDGVLLGTQLRNGVLQVLQLLNLPIYHRVDFHKIAGHGIAGPPEDFVEMVVFLENVLDHRVGDGRDTRATRLLLFQEIIGIFGTIEVGHILMVVDEVTNGFENACKVLLVGLRRERFVSIHHIIHLFKE